MRISCAELPPSAAMKALDQLSRSVRPALVEDVQQSVVPVGVQRPKRTLHRARSRGRPGSPRSGGPCAAQRSSGRRARSGPAQPAVRWPASAPADRATAHRNPAPAPACRGSPGRRPPPLPSARDRDSGPSGVATELMKIGTMGRAVASPNNSCSGCTVPWSTSMLVEIGDVHPGLPHRLCALLGDVTGNVQRTQRMSRNRRLRWRRYRCRTGASAGRRTRCSGRARR